MRVILVHGAGGSPLTWSLVAPRLKRAGLDVALIDHPSRSHPANVALVLQEIDAREGDVVLVGHSYGGAVITDAGRHPRVRALVYVAAFAPDENESIDDIVARHGHAEVFQESVAGAEPFMPGSADDDWRRHSWDVPEHLRAATGARRRPISEEIYTRPCGVPAWRSTPAWYVVASRDKHVLAEAQRAMAARAGATTTEVRTSHSAPLAAPDEVAAVIRSAIGSATP